MEKLGVVILTWNSQEYMEKCLESIIKITGYDMHVVIVDNGSLDGTCQMVGNMKVSFEKNKMLCELIKLEVNKGTTISRNIGILKLMDCDWICILDSDTIINQWAIDQMIYDLKKKEENGIVGPKMITSSGIIQNSGRHIPTITEKVCKILPLKKAKEYALNYEKCTDVYSTELTPVGYLMSACWMVKREVFEKVGLLDEKIFYAPEDVEFCIRAWQGGYRVLFDGNVEIIHEWQRVSRKKIFSKHNFEHIKGLLYMFTKYKFLFKADKIEELIR